MPLVPKHQRDMLATVEIATPAPLALPRRQEKPQSIVGESRALSRKAAEAKITAFVETLSDREPQHQQPCKRTMSEEERAESLAKYHAKMARMTPEEMEAYRAHRRDVRRKRVAARKAAAKSALGIAAE